MLGALFFANADVSCLACGSDEHPGLKRSRLVMLPHSLELAH
jgi:hypothetical protein